MAKFICLNTDVFIEVADDADPQDIANLYESGATAAMSHFPKGDVIETNIENVRTLDADEISERGFEEG